MLKEARISIKVDAELRAAFNRAAAAHHQTPAQVLRKLMRFYVEDQEIPNAETIAAMEAAERGEVIKCDSIEDMLRKLEEE
jgi:predicted transcriptional regulator